MISRLPGVLLAAGLSAGLVACGNDGNAVPAPPPDPRAPVTLIAVSELRAAVPHLPEWTRGEITTQAGTTSDPGVHVLAIFSRGSEKLELEIADTGGDERAIESLEHLAGSAVNRTVGNGYFKGTVVSAFPAVESWNTVDHLGELSVLIRRRYILHVAGSGLADAAPMRTLAEAVDMSRLH